MQDFRNNTRDSEKAQAADGSKNPESSKTIIFLNRAIGGDYEAFGELYSIYLDRIYRYVFYQVRDKMTAEDITEEVFLKAWKAIGSCKGKERTFKSWLYRIAHNCIIDGYRRDKKMVPLEKADEIEVYDTGEKFEEKLERQDLLEKVSGLSLNQQQVVILKFVEDMDNEEIAKIMGKSQGAVRVLQMRALAALRESLNGR